KEDGSVDPADIRLDGIDFHPEWVRDGSGQPFAGHVESVALHVRSGQSTNVDFKGASEFTARNLKTGQTATIHLQCTTNDAQLARETREAEAAALQAGMVQHIKWESEQAQPQYMKPVPDPQRDSAQWLQQVTLAGHESSIGSVTIMGGSATDIARSYAVRSVPRGELSQALQVNGRVTGSEGRDVNAKFVGNAVEIKLTDKAKSSDSGIKAVVDYLLPAPSGGVYQLARFETKKGRAAWIVDGQATTYMAGRRQFAAAISQIGHYAVVLVSAPATKTELIKGP